MRNIISLTLDHTVVIVRIDAQASGGVSGRAGSDAERCRAMSRGCGVERCDSAQQRPTLGVNRWLGDGVWR